jgi:hypothetical protein
VATRDLLLELYSEIAAQRCARDAAWFNAELPAGRPRDAAAANAQRAACCAACTNMLLCPDKQSVRTQVLGRGCMMLLLLL